MQGPGQQQEQVQEQEQRGKLRKLSRRGRGKLEQFER
jgi:hypothetical protein